MVPTNFEKQRKINLTIAIGDQADKGENNCYNNHDYSNHKNNLRSFKWIIAARRTIFTILSALLARNLKNKNGKTSQKQTCRVHI